MNVEQIQKDLLKLLTKVLEDNGVNSGCIGYSTDMIEDLGVDSIIFISLIVDVESYFKIRIPDDLLLMENFRTINDFGKVIFNLLER